MNKKDLQDFIPTFFYLVLTSVLIHHRAVLPVFDRQHLKDDALSLANSFEATGLLVGTDKAEVLSVVNHAIDNAFHE